MDAHVILNPENDPRRLPTPRNEYERKYIDKLYSDYEFFAAECLLIVPKGNDDLGDDYIVGAPVTLNLTPRQFLFNDAQKIFHRFVETMLAETLWIRVNVVKGRQQGISAYIDGRLIWECFRQANYSAYILSHEDKSTQTLFKRLKFFYDNCPPQYKPGHITSNSLELEFRNGSIVKVMTAGSKETGRSMTMQGGHESERAFYPHVENIDAGIGQTIPDTRGTSKFRESTGNGKNHFYKECLDGLPDQNGVYQDVYRTIFIPWYLQQEYRLPLPKHLLVTDDQGTHLEYIDDEIELRDTFKLDDEQLYWRRAKIKFLKSLRKFRQEYPFTFQEAFQDSGNTFFDLNRVQKARKSQIKSSMGAWLIGCDPGRKNDRTAITERRGRAIENIETYREMTETRLAGILANKIDIAIRKGYTVRCFIDAANGTGTYDVLVERGYGRYVELIYFGGKSSKPHYLNKRVEMNFEFREWLEDEVSIPDDDEVEVDIAMLPDSELNSNSKHTLVAKEKIRKENQGRSPDILDSIVLTFAETVRDESQEGHSIYSDSHSRAPVSELATRRRMLDNDRSDDPRGRFSR